MKMGDNQVKGAVEPVRVSLLFTFFACLACLRYLSYREKIEIKTT